MRRDTLLTLAVLGLLTCTLQANNNPLVRVGMVQSLFTDVPAPLVQLVTEPFGAVMKEATGLPGQLVVGGDTFDVARKLNDNDLQLAVFNGFEFAWAQQKHPELKPLMVAVNAQRQVSAFMMVRKDSEATSIAELRGKSLSVPKRTKEHCRLFVDRHCTDCEPKEFFKEIVASVNVETALDELCLGKVDAVVIDTIGLEFYKDLKPGCFARLKVLEQSDPFPPAVIAYRSGNVSDEALSRFRTGLLTAHKTALGREMMKMWKISAFENVPADYAQSLADVLKAYPAPEAANLSRR